MGNVKLRKDQYRFSEDNSKCIEISRNFIIGKIYNARWVIERAVRDYAMRLDSEKLKQKSCFLQNSLKQIKLCSDMQQLRGIEGEAASVYFSVLDDLILQQYVKVDRSFVQITYKQYFLLLVFAVTFLTEGVD